MVAARRPSGGAPGLESGAAASFPIRLLEHGMSPDGPWGRLLISGVTAPDRWREEAAAHQVEVSISPAGVSLGGPLPRIQKLASALPQLPGAKQLEAAARALQRAPRPLQIGSHHWAFGSRTRLLGVVNVTPDSFSGDGVGGSPAAALERAARMVEEGADGIDVGGESSRPGHTPVSVAEELQRVVPAVERIASALGVPVFVDTWKAAVADAALSAGAGGINDIWGLRRDPEMARVAAAHGAAVLCMHNQDGAEYQDLLGEVLGGLAESVRLARAAGVPEAQILLDPGIGFGKTPAQNLEVLAHLEQFRMLGRPLLVGTSRKSLVGWLLGNRPVEGRLFGTAATVAWAVCQGADVVRVHDVAAMRDTALVARRLSQAASRPPA